MTSEIPSHIMEKLFAHSRGCSIEFYLTKFTAISHVFHEACLIFRPPYVDNNAELYNSIREIPIKSQ